MDNKGNLLLRNDTFLGVCEGLGQDFGFHANWLRIAFALAFFFSPVGVVAAYLGLGLIVAVSRLAFPNRSGATISHERDKTSAQDKEDLALAA